MNDALRFNEGGQKVIPVLHLNDGVDYLQEVEKARAAQTDGIFLIDHNHYEVGPLEEAVQSVKQANPDFMVGVNYLQIASGMAALTHLWLKRQQGEEFIMPDMLWADRISTHIGTHANILDTFKANGMGGLGKDWGLPAFFGSVAFKYTPEYTEDPELAASLAKLAEPLVDVIVTSGPATGQAANPNKIKSVKDAVKKPVALSSGVSEQNVHLYGRADILMVSSSIETDVMSGRFNELALRALVKAVQRLNRQRTNGS